MIVRNSHRCLRRSRRLHPALRYRASTTRAHAARLPVRGAGAFSDSAAQHITEIVVPIVDRILEGLRVPRKNFDISLVNLGATAIADIGLKTSGFSADVPAFLALLSAGLSIPLPQDMVTTVHVASTDGDIASVRAIPAKLAATQADPTIRRFVYPATAGDGSLPALSPGALRELEEAIVSAQECLRLASAVKRFQSCSPNKKSASASV